MKSLRGQICCHHVLIVNKCWIQFFCLKLQNVLVSSVDKQLFIGVNKNITKIIVLKINNIIFLLCNTNINCIAIVFVINTNINKNILAF